MSSLDDLFNKPGSNKRKFEPVKDPNEVYKAVKLTSNGDAKGKAHVEDVEDDEDIEAGPELPPDDDAEEEEAQDDEDGRFFGGGVSRNTADVLDFIEERDGQDAAPEKIDPAWVRRLAVSFERKISKNAELRAKFEDDPQKFLGSEADLDAEIKGLSILSEHTELYEEFAKLGCVGSLVSLLAHENADIAIDAIEIIAELIDEDVAAEPRQWDAVVSAMVDSDLPDLLVQNFDRLDEVNESDRNGVYHSLSVLESLASQAVIAEKIVESSSLIPWLLKRVQRKEAAVTQNKQYAAEILAIYLQSSPKIRTTAITLDTVDLLLQLLAAYRKIDPSKDGDEEEYVENIFDCLTCLVDSSEGKQKFVDAEGVELALIMLRQSKFSKPRALRVLDHAMGGTTGIQTCEKLVEVAGLKTVFGIFMKQADQTTTEHILGMFSSMLRSLPGASAERIRTLAKFMEKDYEKLNKLVQLRRDYARKLRPVEHGIKAEGDGLSEAEKEDLAAEWLSRRLDAGLFTFETLDVILAWLVAEDGGARKKISQLLAEQDEGLDSIKRTLQQQLAGLEAGSDDQTEEEVNAKEMLRTLIDCI